MKGYVSAPAEVEVNLRPFRSASRSGLESSSPALLFLRQSADARLPEAASGWVTFPRVCSSLAFRDGGCVRLKGAVFHPSRRLSTGMAAQEACTPNPLEPKAHFPSRIHPSPRLQRKCDTLSSPSGTPGFWSFLTAVFLGVEPPTRSFATGWEEVAFGPR